MSETKFELRELKSADLFPMFAILSKIGFKDLKDSLSADTISGLLESVKSDETDEKDEDTKVTALGFSIIMEVVEVIMKNLPHCEKEIYNFLAGLSGMTAKEIAELPMVTFTEMIIAVIQKDEFKDFFKVVSGLFK